MASSAKKKPALTDRLIGLIEGLSAGEECAEEELEFLAHRIAALEERLVLVDGEYGAAGSARRAHENLIDSRRATGLKAKSIGVTADGRLQFSAGARKR